jgi:hypothetical protein
MSPDSPNGWNEWSKYVLKELERLNLCYEALDGKTDDIKEVLVAMKVKMGFIGGVAGLVVGGIISLVVRLAVR